MNVLVRQVLAACAAIVIGTSIASAFPIQNKTDTDAPGSLGASLSVKIAGVTTGTYNVGGFTTKTKSVDNSNGYTGSQMFDGSGMVADIAGAGDTYSYRTYCMELTQGLNLSNVTTRIERIPPAGGLEDPTNGTVYAADSNLAAQRAAWVISYAETIIGPLNTGIAQAAVQLAIWEIMYDAGLSGAGDLITTGPETPGFKVTSNLGAANARTDQGKAVDFAQQLLAASVNKKGIGYTLRQGRRFDNPTGAVGSGQDLITAVAVPEPTSLAIVAFAGLGFAGYGLRRRRQTS